MTHQLIASPYPEGHLVVRPGYDGAVRIGAARYAELCDAPPGTPVPAWLAEAVRAGWGTDITGRPIGGTILVRSETGYGYARASYEVNLGCNYDCEHCYLGEKMFAGMDWPGRERLLQVMADAGVLWLQLTGGCLCARRVPYRSCLIYSGSSEQKKSCPDLTAGGELRAHACAWRKSWLALRAACGEVSMSR